MIYTGMHNIFMPLNCVTRSLSPENPTGAKGRGGMCPPEEGSAKRACADLGHGWKVNPYIAIEPGETAVIADIDGPGVIKHIWMTPTGSWRHTIIRCYWEDQHQPSVECPVGDFFCMGWNTYAQLSSAAICVNPGSAFNSYFPMPFGKKCRITMENIGTDRMLLYYQIDYLSGELPDGFLYFHAQYRRVNPLPYKETYTILDGITGRGHYAGTYMAWGSNSTGWWGEGEIKFYIDGDKYPTICGTGTEDYFCGSYNFEDPAKKDRYLTFCTPYAGLHQAILPDGQYKSQTRFGMYRWHIADPVCFGEDLKVTIQALGWYKDGTYRPLQDDLASVAYWYQTMPTPEFQALKDRHYLEV